MGQPKPLPLASDFDVLTISTSTRAGSHAGRGFRYQDAVGAWLAVRCWTDLLPFGEVVPEGLDDFELVGDQPAFVQAKSRRDGLGPFPKSQVAGFIGALWDRHDGAPAKPELLILILERPVAGWSSAEAGGVGAPLTAADIAGTVLEKDARRGALMGKTHIVVAPAPLEEAVATLAETLSCPPLMAQLYYGEVLRRIGELSDQNGLAQPSGFAGLAKSDIDFTIETLRSTISVDDMEAALRDGLCEPIDFLTPLDDPLFFFGVDVRPGHLAAGLVSERPVARGEVLAALEDRHAALIAGPSGAGKSALMWEAAHASRHTVRWFQVRRLAPEEAPILIRLMRALRASTRSPVGFIFDDVGRGLAAGWDTLVRETAVGAGLVMLGSIREEDVFLLSARARAAEIRRQGDEDLAERIWAGLRAQRQTAWEGWREPWARSRGLLLEYAHLLTHGDRLSDLLGEQIDRRLREERDLELEVVRLAALAGAAGATVEMTRLQSVLETSPPDLARALRRLLEEHLLRDEGGGHIGGLHQLRSAELLRLSHASPPPTLAASAARCAAAVPNAELELFVSRTLAAMPELEGPLMDGLVGRITADPDPAAAAGVLFGLGQAHVVRTVRKWLPELKRLGVAPTQATTAAMFAVAKTELPGIDQLTPIMEAAKLLQTAADADPRRTFIQRLPTSVLSHLLEAAGPAALEALLAALVGGEPPAAVIDHLRGRKVDLMSLDLHLAARLLATTRLLDPDSAMRWASEAGQTELLVRIHNEIPWTTEVELVAEDGQVVVRGDIRYIAASAQNDVHEEVVHLCELLLALAPSAEVAAVNAITADGELAGLVGYPMATKRIPRGNLPPDALPSWNRRWAAAVAYEVGAESYTEYLARAKAALGALVPRLERVFDLWMRGGVNDQLLEQIGEVHDLARLLTPPRERVPGAQSDGATQGGELYVTRLQGVLFDASADLLRRFAHLPDGHGAYVYWVGNILEHLAEARREPWELVGGPPGDLFDRLAALLESLRILAAEAGARDAKPPVLWKTKAKAARQGNALRLVAHEVRQTLQRRTAEVKARVERAAESVGLVAQVHVRLDAKQPLPWPACEVLVVLALEGLADWEDRLIAGALELRAAAGEGRNLHIVPSVGGKVVSRLAVAGVGLLFPSPYAVDEWLKALGDPLLDDASARSCEVAIEALVEIDGLRTFGYGAGERPSAEQAALATATERLSGALQALEPLLEPCAPGVWDQVREFVATVESGDITLAIDFAAMLHGEESGTSDALKAIGHVMLTCDLIRQLERQEKAGEVAGLPA